MWSGFLQKSLPKNISASILAFVAFCVLCVTQAGVAQAADSDKQVEGIFITPAINQIDLKNGQVYTGKMNVRNTTKEDMTVKMDVTGYTIKDNNYSTPDYDNESKYSTMRNWIHIASGQEEFVLKPGENRDVEYTINTPSNPPGGTQYATVMATNVPKQQEGVSGISALARIGMVVMANMVDGNTIDKTEITNVDIPFYQPTAPLRSSFSVENKGNIGASVQYKMNVTNAINGAKVGDYKNSDGSDSATVASGSNTIFPESTRTMDLKWDKMPIGFYNVELVVNINGKTETFKKFVCAVPLWVIILIIIAIISLIGYFIVNRRMSNEAKAAANKSKTGGAKASTSGRRARK